MKRDWIAIPIEKVIWPVSRVEVPIAGKIYRQIGVKLWGGGAYEREPIDGSRTKYAKFFRAETGDLIVNKIWARNGSVAVVPSTLAGCYGSGEFPMFSPDRAKLDPNWMHWLTKTRVFWSKCDEKSQGTSGKNRIRPDRFLEIKIPLPPLEEQQRIVERIEELAAQIQEARTFRQQEEREIRNMLVSAFHRISHEVPRKLMREVAPLVRRPIKVDFFGSYPELGIRSFGKGTFHKPALSGSEVGNKRVFRIEPADLIFSNVFAWEGAIAVAKDTDRERVGSHRFITCVPRRDIVTSNYLCFYFLTEEGLELIRAASPGAAGRNRTLGLAALDSIRVPIPQIEKQRWFDALHSEVNEIRRLQNEMSVEFDALLPAILDRAFKGKL